MKCSDKEWQHCRVEKMGCEGCYYDESNTFKATIPLVTDEDLKYIDSNFDSIVDEFNKKIIRDKDLAIAQYIIKKQKNKIKESNNLINQLRCGAKSKWILMKIILVKIE